MPGIVGILSSARPEDAARAVRTMLNSIRHEPFYTSGIYGSDELGVYVGWASHREAFDDNMPLFNPQQKIVLIFSGQEYSGEGTGTVPAGGSCTPSVANAAYLVSRYEKRPKDFLRSLNGWFRGVL